MRCCLLLFLTLVEGSFKFHIENDPRDSRIAKCVEKIAKKSFARRDDVLIITNREDNDLSNEILTRMESEFAVTLADISNYEATFYHIRYYIFVLRRTSSKNPFEYLTKMRINPRSKYVIITENDSKYLEDTGADLWNVNGVFNLIFLRCCSFRGVEEELDIIGYDVLAKHLNSTGLYLADRCRGDENAKRIDNDTALFPSKFRDMKGFPLRVSVANVFDIEPDLYLSRKDNGSLEIDGVGSMIVKTFASKLNFRMIVTEHESFGYRQPDGTWNGLIGDLSTGKSDLSFAGILPTVRVIEKLDYTDFYRWEALNFAMKRQRKVIASWASIFEPFSKLVRIYFTGVLILVLGLIWIMRKLRSLKMITESPRVVDFFKVLLNQSVKYPKTTGLRMVFALWLIYAYLMSTSYSSSLVSFLSRPVLQPELDTLKELQESHLKIGGPSSVKAFLSDGKDLVAKYIHDSIVEMKYSELDASMFEKNMVSIKIRSSGIIQNWKNRFNDSLQLHMLRDPVVTYPTFYYMKRGHPYREPLSSYLGLFHASGLIDKWLSDFGTKVSGIGTDEQNGTVILTLQHFAALFAILFIGYFLSVVAFVIEYYWH